MTEDADILHYDGVRVRIYLVRRPDGSVPAQTYLDGLDQGDRAKFAALFEQLGDEGKIFNNDRFRMIDDVAEFKTGGRKSPGRRMWGMWGAQGMFVTHGNKKPKDRRLAVELQRARAIFAERRSTG